jgi:riboflavin biosynthesis pyrimidine reductase
VPEITFKQLLPPGDELDAPGLLDALPLGPAPQDRPYTLANFVISADGRATFEGRSAPLSDPGDRALFHVLRARVDAVLAGTGTLAVERYGRMVPRAEVRAEREARGLRAEPLAATLSRAGSIPLDIPLFAEPEAEVVVFSPRPSDTDGAAATVHHEHYEASSPLASAMTTLRQRHQVQLLLCEGGPHLFAALVREHLVDELFVTVAPKLAGGDGPGVLAGPPLPALEGMALRTVVVRDGTLFLRYVMKA